MCVYVRLAWVICLIIMVNGDIKLSSDGRFNNLLIYINDDVPEDSVALNNMQLIVTEASKIFYKATSYMTNERHKISFGEVHIRVPKSWKVIAEPITWQQCVKLEFQVVTKRMNGNSDVPFTKQLLKCGEPGLFNRFTDTFFKINNNEQIRSKGKQLLREFVKLRYGVFSEEPDRNVLYGFNGTHAVQSSCPEKLKWSLNNIHPSLCSDKNKICSYKIERGQSHNYSIMFDTETPTSDYFCDDNSMPHNRYGYNIHNKKCNRQSVSAVILKHNDFQSSRGLVKTDYKNPIFRIVKAQSRRIVLVLDTSGSMHPVENAAKKALKHFIQNTIEDGAELGIVTFSTNAYIQSNLSIVDAINRLRLLNIIDSLIIQGQTNIGDGLLKGVEVLGGNISSNDKMYGTIILLSDGENSEDGEIDYQEAIKNIIKKAIVTYTISYGDISDPDLNKLSKETGGMFTYASFNSSVSDLFSKFSIQKACDSSEKRQVEALRGNMKIDLSNSIVNFTYIDKFVGSDTVIEVNINEDISKKIIKLIDPHGIPFLYFSKIENKNMTTLVFKIAGRTSTGMYKLQIIPIRRRRYKRSVESIPITFKVSGTPHGQSYNPEGMLSTTMIDYVKETSSVTITIDLSSIDLNEFEEVQVSMTMEYPNGTLQVWKMADDGLGDDSIGSDRIFSRTIYARCFTDKGFYQFRGNVTMVDIITKVAIRRTVEMESLRVNDLGSAPIKDKVPPASIHDINIITLNKDKRTVTVKFVAPGDDSMTGNITLYQVRMRSKGRTVMDMFTEHYEPYDTIIRVLDLRGVDMEETIALSIRGVDTTGNNGSWSSWVHINH